MKRLFYNSDDPETSAFIKHAISKKYFVERHTRYHIKIGPMNFWPTTGTISIEGGPHAAGKGFDAAYALLKNISPKVTHSYVTKQSPLVISHPILSLSLDDDPGEETNVGRAIIDIDPAQ